MVIIIEIVLQTRWPDLILQNESLH